jgi:hypothetical protein
MWFNNMRVIKKILFAIVGLMFAFACKAQDKSIDCSNVVQGKFYYIQDSTNHKVIIERRKKKQMETNETTGETTTFKITWTSNCSYQLKQIWSNKKERRKKPYGNSEITITEASESGYTSTCNCLTSAEVKPKSIKVYKIS